MIGYVGEIRMVAFNFAPVNWLPCDGRSLPMGEKYKVLYSVIQTKYGGDGHSFFKLPDFRGRAPVGMSENYKLGETFGEESISLQKEEIPLHTHSINISDSYANQVSSEDAIFCNTPINSYKKDDNKIYMKDSHEDTIVYQNNTEIKPLDEQTIGYSGSSAPHDNIQPSIGLKFLICICGIYPSRV